MKSVGLSTKHQNPSSKQIPIIKSQNSGEMLEFGALKIGASLEFGVCDLGFPAAQRRPNNISWTVAAAVIA